MAALKHTRKTWPLVLAMLMVSINLRPILAAIGPLLHEIQLTTGLSSPLAGLLTTLPVLAMGIGALLGARLQVWMGEYRGILLGVSFIALACALRWSVPSAIGLILTAALGGLGIALVQALLPVYLKKHFPEQISPLMGLYTTGIMGGAAVAAGAVAPLALILNSWPAALSVGCIPALLALELWGLVAVDTGQQAAVKGIRLPLRSARAWLLMLFFGIGTGAYTLVLAWLPPFYRQLGWSGAQSGLLLGALTLVEVVAGLGVSLLISRFTDRRIAVSAVLLSLLAGLLCLIVAPLALAIPAMVLLGLGIGGLFPLSLIVTMDHARDPGGAGALMAFVQGGGYILASIMPLLAGLIREHSTDLTLAWEVMVAGVLVLLVIATRLSPEVQLDTLTWRLQPR
jgi:CP family cyanate transporter-like MFS transporter